VGWFTECESNGVDPALASHDRLLTSVDTYATKLDESGASYSKFNTHMAWVSNFCQYLHKLNSNTKLVKKLRSKINSHPTRGISKKYDGSFFHSIVHKALIDFKRTADYRIMQPKENLRFQRARASWWISSWACTRSADNTGLMITDRRDVPIPTANHQTWRSQAMVCVSLSSIRKQTRDNGPRRLTSKSYVTSYLTKAHQSPVCGSYSANANQNARKGT
jgi:hypothetical protein